MAQLQTQHHRRPGWVDPGFTAHLTQNEDNHKKHHQETSSLSAPSIRPTQTPTPSPSKQRDNHHHQEIYLSRHLNKQLDNADFANAFSGLVQQLKMDGKRYQQLPPADKIQLIKGARDLVQAYHRAALNEPTQTNTTPLNLIDQINQDLRNPNSLASQQMNNQSSAIQAGLLAEEIAIITEIEAQQNLNTDENQEDFNHHHDELRPTSSRERKDEEEEKEEEEKAEKEKQEDEQEETEEKTEERIESETENNDHGLSKSDDASDSNIDFLNDQKSITNTAKAIGKGEKDTEKLEETAEKAEELGEKAESVAKLTLGG